MEIRFVSLLLSRTHSTLLASESWHCSKGGLQHGWNLLAISEFAGNQDRHGKIIKRDIWHLRRVGGGEETLPNLIIYC